MSVTDQIAFDLDILGDGRLASKLSIELYQKPGASLARRMVELISRLRDGNLCVLQKTIGLLAWGGITHGRRRRDLWPATLIARKTLRGDSESSTFARWLHHIKIVLEPNGPPIAKVTWQSATLSWATLQSAKCCNGPRSWPRNASKNSIWLARPERKAKTTGCMVIKA